MHLKLSVDASPDQRPHGKLGIWGPAVTTLGNISKMPVSHTYICVYVCVYMTLIRVLYESTSGKQDIRIILVS